MPSTLVTFSDARARALASSAETHGARIATEVAGALAVDAPKGAKAVQLRTLVDALASHVAASSGRLSSAQTALDAERSDDDEPRARRDEFTEKLYTELAEFRGVVEAAAGPRAVAALGFVGATPREPGALLALAGTVLANAKTKPPVSRSKAVTLDVPAAVRAIEPQAKRLATALDDVAREGREEQAARLRRDRAQAEFDATARAVGLVLEGLLRLAKLDEHADQLRLAERAAPGGGEEKEPEPPR